MQRRIFGLESEFGVTCTLRGQRRLSPDEAARYLFRSVVSWGRSSNVFLENGARLYLDVGSHPEYATPECLRLEDLVAHDKAGDRVLEKLRRSAEQRLAGEGIRGDIFLYKNNTDTAGNSYGCHENYLVDRKADFNKILDVLIPFLVTRQIYTGAGKLHQTPRGPVFTISQRAEHIWDTDSSATTRSRPIINTRDEPHADAERYRRLHVIAGDSNMNEFATFVKVGTVAALLEMIEDGAIFRDMTLKDPIMAIREISKDLSCRDHKIEMAKGGVMSALDIQWEYWERVNKYARNPGFRREAAGGQPGISQAVKGWEYLLNRLKEPLSLVQEVDWVTKYHLIERYRSRYRLPLSHPRVMLLDLSYHDVSEERGLYNLLARRGAVRRMVTDAAVAAAVMSPPQDTRARLRGRFIAAAKAKNRQVTVDWVHLKVNDQAQQTVICKDPFGSQKEADKVDQLIERL